MKTKLLFMLFLLLGLGFAGVVSASDACVLQPAATVVYDEDLTVNGTGRFDSVYIGKQGVGGVTFFNGTIINATVGTDDYNNPITIADNVRIDGSVFRGETPGPLDDKPFSILDHLYVEGGIFGDGHVRIYDELEVTKAAKFVGAVTIQGGTPWTDKNDGAGSSLNADLLDGKQASDFSLKGHNHDDRYWQKGTFTRYWSVTGNIFQSLDESACDYTKAIGPGYLYSDSNCDYVAQVNLPDGALVKEVQMTFKDNLSDPNGYFGIDLIRIPFIDSGAELMAEVNSNTEDTQIHARATTNIASASIDTENNAYYLHTNHMEGTGADHTLYTVRIKYEVTEPLP